MAYIGGLRARLIHDNLFNVLEDGLDELGWLNTDRNHAPVTVRKTQVKRDENIEPNVVCITAEDVNEMEAEMGSLLSDNIWSYYVDVYAEDSTLGLHLATDIRDIFSGKFTTSVSRRGPDIDIYDLSVQSATPIDLFSVEISDVQLDRTRFFEKPYQEYWWVVSFSVLDSYATEED